MCVSLHTTRSYIQMHIHQGVIVESVEEASHVIYPPPPPSPNDEEYVRPLLVRGKTVLVHWWYYPDRWECSKCMCVCVFVLFFYVCAVSLIGYVMVFFFKQKIVLYRRFTTPWNSKKHKAYQN